METARFELALERETQTSVWKQWDWIRLITRSVANIHNDLHSRNERWISGGNNDLYKAHASLSPDRFSMYLYIEVDAQLKTDAFNAALYMILGTKMFGSYVSKDLRPSSIADEVATLLADE